jgi:hypothetical protein
MSRIPHNYKSQRAVLLLTGSNRKHYFFWIKKNEEKKMKIKIQGQQQNK